MSFSFNFQSENIINGTDTDRSINQNENTDVVHEIDQSYESVIPIDLNKTNTLFNKRKLKYDSLLS